MKKNWLFVGTTLTLLLAGASIHAQTNAEVGLPFIRNYSPKEYNGAAQNWAIVQDDRGIMYFGNEAGVMEYDGVAWRAIGFPNKSTGRSLAKDDSGRIYVGGVGELGYLRADSLGAMQYVSLLPELDPKDRNFADVWTTTATPEGIYFLASNRLFRWANGKMKVWPADPEFHVCFWVNGSFYVRRWDIGLTRMQGDSLVLVPDGERFAGERIYAGLPYDEGRMLIGTRTQGLFLYDGVSFQPFKTEADDYLRRNSLYLPGAVLADDTFVLGTLSGGVVFIDANGRLVKIVDRDAGLRSNNVYYVYRDQQEALWVALDDGLARLEPGSPLSRFGQESGLSSAVYGIIRHHGTLYVSANFGVFWFDRSTSTFKPVAGINDQSFQLLEVGNELLAVTNSGLYGISGTRARPVRPSVNYDFRSSFMYRSKQDSLRFFVATEQGLAALHAGPGLGWRDDGMVPGINVRVQDIAETKPGTVWLGTSSQGVLRVMFKSGPDGAPLLHDPKVEQFDVEHGLPRGSTFVSEINGTLYFFTTEGLFTFEETTRRFQPDSLFTQVDGRLAGGGARPFRDQKGRVWLNLGRESAVATLQPDGGYVLVRAPFLPFADTPIYNIYAEPDGIVWFGGQDGLIRYDEKTTKDYQTDYPAFIRKVTDSKNTTVYAGAVEDASEPRLPASKNSLHFEFASPSFGYQDKMQYQAFLEGFDEHWSAWSNKTEKEYTNLPADNYRFRIRARNVYEHPSSEAVFSFTILPPWYQTWWAYLLYILAGGGLIFGFIRLRTQKLEERSRELEKSVQERTEEIRRRVEELAVINSVQDGLVRELNIQAIYKLVGEKIRDIFDAQVAGIATFDHEAGMEHFQYVFEKGEEHHPEPRPISGLRLHLVRTGKQILINDDLEEMAEKLGGAPVLKGTEQTKSALYVPMVVGETVKGYITLQNVDREHAFSESDVRLLSTLTNSMSVALENARLFDETNRLLAETNQRAQELGMINSVQEGLAKELDIQAIYDLVGNQIRDLFDAQVAAIATFDHETDLETFQYLFEKGERYYPEARPIDGIRRHLIKTRQQVVINENAESELKELGWLGVVEGTEISKSMLYVPMVVGKAVKGYITLQNIDREHAFSDSDVRLLTTLTNTMSVALENARLFDETNRLLTETEQRARELATVNSIGKALASQLHLEELLQLVGDQMKELFKANIVYVALLDKDTNMIHFPYGYGDDFPPLQFGKGLTSQILRKGDPLLLNEDVKGSYDRFGIAEQGKTSASYLGVPIPIGDEIAGVISVQSTEQKNRFGDTDMRLLNTIAAHVGVAMQNAQLFDVAQEARDAAEEANEAKSAFLSTVSHELRTPLTSVLGFAKIIKKRLETRVFPMTNTEDGKTHKAMQQVSDNLDVVVAEGERLTTLINDVLDLAKIEAGKLEWNMETIALPEIIERATSATTALFESVDLKLVKHIDADLPDIVGDPDRLIQVMINLISNAVKFTDKGSVTCEAKIDNKEIVVSVIDTGMGISEADRSMVFDKFKQVGDTLTDKPKGTGLGLPICREIIEHHGGRIWVESKIGKGSTFSFTLPVIAQGAETGQLLDLGSLVRKLKDSAAITPAPSGQHQTILVVDDEAHIRSLLEQELSEAGYKVRLAENGRRAIEEIRRERPDLVILDVMMPEMNGFDVAAVLKNDPKTMDIPILILSIVQDKERGFRLGIDRYLTKPIDTEALFREVGTLLEQGKSKKKVMVVDEDSSTVKTLAEVLQARGYTVVAANGPEMVAKAVAEQPDIIILNSVLSDKQEIVKTLRFEKGLENVLFLLYQ